MYIFLTMSCAVGSTAIVTIPNLEKNTNSGAIKWLDINHPVCRAQCYEPHQPLLNYRGWWRWHCGSRIEKKENRNRKPCFQEHDVSCANESNGGTTFFDKMVFPKFTTIPTSNTVFLSCLKYVLLKGFIPTKTGDFAMSWWWHIPSFSYTWVTCSHLTLCVASVPEVCLMGSLHFNDLQWTIGKYPTKKDPGATYLGGWTSRTTSWRGDFWSEICMVPYGISNYSDSLIWVRTGLVSYKIDLFQSLAFYFVGLTTSDDYICQRKHESGSVKSELECKPTRPRLDSDNAMRLVSFKRNSASPIEALFRRVGRPRTQWTHSTLSLIWKQIRTDDSDFTNSDQLQRIERTQRRWNIKMIGLLLWPGFVLDFGPNRN